MAVTAWKRVYETRKRAEEYPLLMKLAGGKWHSDMLSATVQSLSLLEREPATVLELGVGTGKLASRLLRRLPRTRLVALDGSAAMLGKARQNLRRFGRRVSFHRKDFGLPRWNSDLPAADAVVSTIAIHHLTDAGKRRLYWEVFRRLKPGGLFINGDAVWPEDRRLKERDDRMWAVYIRGRLKAATGEDKPVPEIVSWIERTRRAEGDRPASLEIQLFWLRQAGFLNVDCWWKNFGFAVFGGVKP